ncbi:hypothetical protein ES703_119545 [subsurface metagenome]
MTEGDLYIAVYLPSFRGLPQAVFLDGDSDLLDLGPLVVLPWLEGIVFDVSRIQPANFPLLYYRFCFWSRLRGQCFLLSCAFFTRSRKGDLVLSGAFRREFKETRRAA